MRARHHVQAPKTRVSRASDEEAVALLRASRSARDRLLVLTLCRVGLRRSEAMGLRREDIHFLHWVAIACAAALTVGDVASQIPCHLTIH
jgi:integrase